MVCEMGEMDRAGLLNTMTTEELMETCKRLQRSCQDMTMLLNEFEQEQDMLYREQDRLHQRIKKVATQVEVDKRKEDRGIVWSLLSEVDVSIFKQKAERQAAKRRRTQPQASLRGGTQVEEDDKDSGPFSDASVQKSWGCDISLGALRQLPSKSTDIENLERWLRDALCSESVAEADSALLMSMSQAQGVQGSNIMAMDLYTVGGASSWTREVQGSPRPPAAGGAVKACASGPPASRTVQSSPQRPTVQSTLPTAEAPAEGELGDPNSVEDLVSTALGIGGSTSSCTTEATSTTPRNRRESLSKKLFDSIADWAVGGAADDGEVPSSSLTVVLRRSSTDGNWGLGWVKDMFHTHKRRVVNQCVPNSIAGQWNKEQEEGGHPERCIQPGDELVSANGKTSPQEISVELSGSEVVLEFHRTATPATAEAAASAKVDDDAPSDQEVPSEAAQIGRPQQQAPVTRTTSSGSNSGAQRRVSFQDAFSSYLKVVAPSTASPEGDAKQGESLGDASDMATSSDAADVNSSNAVGSAEVASRSPNSAGVGETSSVVRDVEESAPQALKASTVADAPVLKGPAAAGAEAGAEAAAEESPGKSSWISWMWNSDETAGGGAGGAIGSNATANASVPTPHAVVVQVLSLGSGSVRLSWLFDWEAAAVAEPTVAASEGGDGQTTRGFEVLQRLEGSAAAKEGQDIEREKAEDVVRWSCTKPQLKLELPTGRRYSFEVRAVLRDVGSSDAAGAGGVSEASVCTGPPPLWTSSPSALAFADLRGSTDAPGSAAASAATATAVAAAASPSSPVAKRRGARGAVASKLGSFLAQKPAERAAASSAPAADVGAGASSPKASSSQAAAIAPINGGTDSSPVNRSTGNATAASATFMDPLATAAPRVVDSKPLNPAAEKREIAERLLIRRGGPLVTLDGYSPSSLRANSVDSDDGSLQQLAQALSSLERSASDRLVSKEAVAQEGHHDLQYRLDGSSPVRPSSTWKDNVPRETSLTFQTPLASEYGPSHNVGRKPSVPDIDREPALPPGMFRLIVQLADGKAEILETADCGEDALRQLVEEFVTRNKLRDLFVDPLLDRLLNMVLMKKFEDSVDVIDLL